MVRQSVKDVDLKKLKMAKEVLAVFEVLGITEDDLDNLVNFKEYKKTLEAEIKSLKEFKEKTLRAEKNEASVSKFYPKSKSLVEEYNLNGK